MVKLKADTVRRFIFLWIQEREEATRPGGAGFAASTHKVFGCHSHVDCSKNVNCDNHDNDYK